MITSEDDYVGGCWLSSSFMVPGYVQAFNPFWVYFCVLSEGVLQLHWFTWGCPGFPAALAEETLSSPFLAPLLKIKGFIILTCQMAFNKFLALKLSFSPIIQRQAYLPDSVVIRGVSVGKYKGFPLLHPGADSTSWPLLFLLSCQPGKPVQCSLPLQYASQHCWQPKYRRQKAQNTGPDLGDLPV